MSLKKTTRTDEHGVQHTIHYMKDAYYFLARVKAKNIDAYVGRGSGRTLDEAAQAAMKQYNDIRHDVMEGK